MLVKKGFLGADAFTALRIRKSVLEQFLPISPMTVRHAENSDRVKISCQEGTGARRSIEDGEEDQIG